MLNYLEKNGEPLKQSSIASKGGLAAIREGLGFPKYGYNVKPFLTPKIERRLFEIRDETENIRTAGDIE